MTLIKWDYKRLLPIWLLMIASMSFLVYMFLQNDGLAVYQRADASRAMLFLPVFLVLLGALLIYSLISLVRSSIVDLKDGHFVFANGPFSKRVPAGDNTLQVLLDTKQRILEVHVLSPDGEQLHRLSPRRMKFACEPEDMPSGYKVDVVHPGVHGVF